MASITRWLEVRLKIKVNRNKSAVNRPWMRKFLGYSMTYHRQPRIKVAEASIERLKGKPRDLFRRGRGSNLARFIDEELWSALRRWANYFQLADVNGVFEEIDGWLRRKLRCILWRRWKRSYTRAKSLMGCGLGEVRAWQSATNGRGPW